MKLIWVSYYNFFCNFCCFRLYLVEIYFLIEFVSYRLKNDKLNDFIIYKFSLLLFLLVDCFLFL